ncbi:hypothetical protein [Vibrio hippocampi]|uniref:Uncharacterized protein n=1 Tax=Vibrio hippocampi TaxID=654686 RepID=A0ABM8ZFZ7_9VIBR|nr:hypothetical protein [Vibrio hippocampi]CAH0525524.1 hypothetical protein VHP8226_01050 [Vibrio hippocampi]
MKYTITIFIFIFSFSALADSAWVIAPDNSWSNGKVMMFNFDEDIELSKVGVAEVSRDSRGNITTFFYYFSINDETRSICDYDRLKDLNNEGQHVIKGVSVHKFNNQPVKMTGFCVAGTEERPSMVYFRPQTYEGLQFVVNQFKKSKSVTVETNYWEEFKRIEFTALGFTKYWDSNNREAL